MIAIIKSPGEAANKRNLKSYCDITDLLDSQIVERIPIGLGIAALVSEEAEWCGEMFNFWLDAETPIYGTAIFVSEGYGSLIDMTAQQESFLALHLARLENGGKRLGL